MKKKIKLTRDYAGHTAGAVLEVEEAIARAYVDSGVAEEVAAPAPATLPARRWIKLTRDVGGHKKDAVLEVEDGVARAYVDSGAAVEHAEAAPTLAASAASEVRAAIDASTAAVRAEFDQALRDLARGLRPTPRVEAGASEDDKKFPSGGFRSIGHFADSVRRGCSPNPEPTCQRAVTEWTELAGRVSRAATGMSEAADPDGAVLVPGQTSDQIWERVMRPERLVARINPIPVSGNSLKIPALKEDSRANGFRHGGILGYWEGEAGQYTGSRPKFRDLELKLKKLTALVYVTEELLQDARALEAFLGRVVPKEIDFKMNDAFIGGSGAGMPKGVMTSQGRIAVAKETGQAAATINRVNVNKMHNRMHAEYRSNAVWLCNQDCEPQLEELDVNNNNAAVALLYSPPGAAGSEFARLKGKPVIPVEQCETLGTEGDLLFCSWENYAAIIKAGVQSAVSMHLRFDYGEVAFRWSVRVDGQPYEASPVTPYKGSTTTASFVSLQARS